MKQKTGIVKNVQGQFKVVDKDGNVRFLKAGDFIYEGDEVSSVYEKDGKLSDSVDIKHITSDNSFMLIQDLRTSEMYLIPQGGYRFFDIQDMGDDEIDIDRQLFTENSSTEYDFDDQVMNLPDQVVAGPQEFLTIPHGRDTGDAIAVEQEEIVQVPDIEEEPVVSRDPHPDVVPDFDPVPNPTAVPDPEPVPVPNPKPDPGENETPDTTVSNNPPVADPDVNAVSETAPATNGNVLGNDSDIDGDTLTVIGVDGTSPGTSVTTDYGVITINPDGSYSYVADPSNPAVSGLNTGETLTDTINYTISDGNGGTASSTLTITINGYAPPPITLVPDTDHAAKGGPDENGDDSNPNTTIIVGNVAGNDTPASTGNNIKVIGVAAGDTDANLTGGTGVGTAVTGTYGTVTINADGSYEYVLDNTNTDVATLPTNGTLQETFTYTATDEDGSIKHTTLTITITGSDQPPKANPDTESMDDSDTSVSGSVISNDTDPENDTLTVVGVVPGSNTGTDTIDNTGVGGAGVDGSYGTIIINPDGTYTYTPNQGTEGMSDGETRTDTFTYTITDGQGGYSTTTVTITITGSNDEPSVNPDVNSVTEDAEDQTGHNDSKPETSIVAGDVLFNDNDPDTNDTLTVVGVAEGNTGANLDDNTTVGSSVNGTYGKVTLNSDGTYEYVLDNTDSSVQALAVRETLTDIFTYTVSDGHGVVKNTTLTITIEGANDAPVISATGTDTDSANLTESNLPLTAEGTLSISDVDTTDEVAMSVVPNTLTFGGNYTGPLPPKADLLNMFTVSGGLNNTQTNFEHGVKWKFDSGTETFDFLPAGKTLTLTYKVQATDSQDATDTHDVTITITGTNDKGKLGAAIDNTTPEDTDVSGDVFESATQDPDFGESLQVSTFTIAGMTGNTYNAGDTVNVTNSAGQIIGEFTLNTDGSYVFHPAEHYSGPVPQVTYTAKSGADDLGSSTLDITVTPVSDAPVIAVTGVETFEDTPVTLGLTVPAITDVTDHTNDATDAYDNPERLGPITLTVPEGVQLLNGNTVLTTGGSVKIVLTNDANHFLNGAGDSGDVIKMTTGEYTALQVNPVAQSHQNFTVEVSVTEFEVDGSGNKLSGVDGKTTTVDVPVEVKAVTDPVNLRIDDGQGNSGEYNKVDTAYSLAVNEDVESNLKDILKADFLDTDGSEERWIVITNPAGNGAIVVNGNTISSGGELRIDATGLETSTTGFPDLNIKAAANVDGDINGIKVELVAKDRDGDSQSHTPLQVSDSVYINLNVAPVAGDITTHVASSVVEDGGRTAGTEGAKFLYGLALTDTDGSEKITVITIKTIPIGWVIKAPDGSLVGVGDSVDKDNYKEYVAIPPANSSADASVILDVTTEDGSATSTDEVTARITVTPQAEKIGVETDGISGADLAMNNNMTYTTAAQEDTAFALNSDGFHLEAGWSNQDGDKSEQTFALLTPQIYDAKTNSYVSAIGATFTWDNGGSATYNGSNGVKIPVAALDSVSFQAPPQTSGSFKIKVQALTVDTDPDDGTISTEISGEAWLTNLNVMPQADNVTLGISQAKGDEDTAIALDIRPFSDDPGETFNITIENIPDGAKIIYDGTEKTVTNKSLTIEGYEPGKLTITPPLNSNDDFTLKVSGQAVDTVTFENGSQTSTSLFSTPLDLKVQVQGVADDANIDTTDKTVKEGDTDSASGKISLQNTITDLKLTDTDGSETATLVISGLVDGINLEGGSFVGGTGEDREWMVSKADIDNGSVNVVVPKNFNGEIPLNVKVVTTEKDGNANPDAASGGVKLTVTPTPEAEMNLSTTVNEDERVKLNFDIKHKNGDTDEEISTVWISKADIDSQGITLTKDDGSALTEDNGWYKISGADIQETYVKGPANKAGDLKFHVKYEVTDPGNGIGDVANVVGQDNSIEYTLKINPVTDETETALSNFSSTDPGASINGGTVIVSKTNTSVTMDVTVSQKSDADGKDVDGSETLHHLVVDGVPKGVALQGGNYIGNTQGIDNTGQWILVVDKNFTGDSITKSLTFEVQGKLSASEMSTIVVKGVSQDGNALTEESSASWTLKTSDNFSADGYQNVTPAAVEVIAKSNSATEDTEIPLKDMLEMSITTGSGPFSIALKDVPDGVTVDGMVKTIVNGHTIWTASGNGGNAELQSLLDSLKVKTSEHWNDNNHSTLDFNASLTTYAGGNENRPIAHANISQAITPVSDPTTVAISPGVAVEDNAIDLDINLSNTADQDHVRVVGGKIYLSLDIEGKVEYQGTELTAQPVTDGAPGVPQGSYYVLEVGNETDIANSTVKVTFTPKEHFSGQVTAEVYGATQEDNADNIIEMNATESFQVEPVNSGYNVNVVSAEGDEDTKVEIKIDANSGLVDTDGSETAVSAILSDVPENYIVFAGADDSAGMANNIGNGTWELPLGADGKLPKYIAVQAPENVSGTSTAVKLTVFSAEQGLSPATTETTFDLNINPVADGLTIDPTNSVGSANNNIAINLNPTMVDTDGSETATVKLTGFGVGDNVEFNAGTSTYNSDTDTYTITGIEHDQLGGLTFKTEYNINKDVTVTAQTVETANNNTSEEVTDDTFKVIVGGGNAYQPPAPAPSFPPGASPMMTSGSPDDDTIVLSDAHIDGGQGEDTLKVNKDVDFTELAPDLIENIEVIDLEGNGAQEITLDANSVENMTDEDNTLLIKGDTSNGSDDTVNLEGQQWTPSGKTDIDATTYNVVENGDNQVKIEDGVNYNIV